MRALNSSNDVAYEVPRRFLAHLFQSGVGGVACILIRGTLHGLADFGQEASLTSSVIITQPRPVTSDSDSCPCLQASSWVTRSPDT